MTTATKITPDTKLFTLTQDFAGYTLIDGILGNMSAGDYAASSQDKSEEQNAVELCDWLETLLRDGAYFLAEADAKTARDEMERGHYYKIEAFTPRSVHNDILRMAAEEN